MMTSNLSLVEATLPPGFRFHPKDEELICDYLMKKDIRSQPSQVPQLIEVDLNKCEPWDIPDTASVGGKEWYFYSQRDRKYATGLRTNRATVSGYWKATGKDRSVFRRGTLVGMRKTLVFYQGRAPKGRKTDWVMHEFRLEGPLGPPKVTSAKGDWVLCRVFYKNREGSGKQGIDSRSCDDTSSCSLPPLTDPYSINFDQAQNRPPNDNNDYEQVPCFSIFTNGSNYPTNQTLSQFTTLTHAHTHVTPNVPNQSMSTKLFSPNPTTQTTFGADVATYLNPSFSCEKNVIKAVLSHMNRMDNFKDYHSHPTSFEEQGVSDQSLLSDVALPAMWYQY